ncbi:MAG TPA: MarC family protein [Actinomycetota bacterium]|nr:MarC family protein [Actinomycetota bacterium]
MQFQTIELYKVVDIFLLLLIGVGPKIALVPFLSATADLDGKTRARVVRKMLVTAGVTALLLVVFGGILTRLLHFSSGALGIAGGLILLIIAAGMMLGRGEQDDAHMSAASSDPMSLATYPLAVPYLLNPAGIVVLVTFSAEAKTAGWFAVMIGLLALVIGIDVAVFRWANRVSETLDQNRMLVTEKVFSILLAAVAVQLVLYGLNDVGVIHLTPH